MKNHNQGLKILYVCTGNTCRSPMAAAISKNKLSGVGRIESAGTYVEEKTAAKEAIDILKSNYEIDISDHTAQEINNSLLNEFDLIIALGPSEYSTLKKYSIDPQRIIKMEIQDPYRQGTEAYKRCASEIENRLPEIKKIIQSLSPSDPTTPKLEKEEDLNFKMAIDLLKKDIDRWQAELDSSFTRGTTLEGMALRSSRTLDKLVRDTLIFYLDFFQINYDIALKKNMKGKPVIKLTPGQCFQCFEKLNRDFTKNCRRHSPKINDILKNRKLLSGEFKKNLTQAIELWNQLHHPPSFRFDESIIKEKISKLLRLIKLIITDDLFKIIEILQIQNE